MKLLKIIAVLVLTLIFNLSLSRAAMAVVSEADIMAVDLNAEFYSQQDECQTTATNNVSPGQVFIIGDSIAAGAKAQLEKGFSDKGDGWSAKVDGLNSRGLAGGPTAPNDGMKAISDNAAEIAKSTAVIIELGTNPPELNAENIKAAVDAIKAVPEFKGKIFWVNNGYAGDANHYSANNDALKAAASQNGFTVIDWASVAGQHPEYFTGDGLKVHPIAGWDPYVKLLVDSVTSGAGQAGGDGLPLVGKDNEEKLFNYFNGRTIKGKTISAQQAAGILGNLYAESGYSPTADNGGHHGIAQWDYQDRLPRLKTFAQGKNLDPDSLEAQALFITEELGGTHAAALNDLVTKTTPEEAAISFLNLFEGAPGQNEGGRKTQAGLVYEKYKGNAPGQGGSGGGVCLNSAASETPGAQDIQVSRAEMVDRLYKNPNFQPTDPSVKADIDSGAAQDGIVKLMLQMVEQYKKPVKIMLVKGSQNACLDFGQGAQNYGTYTSSHWYGLAVDVQGEGTSPEAAGMMKWLYVNRVVLNVGELEHDPVIEGTNNIKFGGDYQYPPAIQKDHHDHIHVAVKGNGEIGPGCTPKPGGEKVD